MFVIRPPVPAHHVQGQPGKERSEQFIAAFQHVRPERD